MKRNRRVDELSVKMNCLYAYNASICLRKAIGTVIENSKNLLNIPLDKYYIAFCEDYKIIDKNLLCMSCEGCLDFNFLTKIWFEYIGELDNIINNEINFINKLLSKFHVPEESWEKYYFIMSLSENKDFLLKNYPVNKDILERVSVSAKTAYLKLAKGYYTNLIADCNDKVIHLYDVLSERKLNYFDIELGDKTTVYFDTNIFSYYISNKNFYTLVEFSKARQYTYVYSPYILEDSIKSDRIHFLHDCEKLIELTDNKTVLPIDDKFSIKKEDVFDCSKRVYLFRDYTQAQEEKNTYKKKLYELIFLPMPNKELNIKKLNEDFFGFLKYIIKKDNELMKYFNSVLYHVNTSLSLTEIVNGKIIAGKIDSVVNELFQFFDYIGYATDKKDKTLKSCVQDMEHIKCASATDLFVTSDEKLYKRATIIYALLGIKTKVMKKDDFRQRLISKEN